MRGCAYNGRSPPGGTMSESGMPKDFFELMQKMWNPMSIPLPGMMTPSANSDDVAKKIAEMKTVETWLTMNIGFVQMTIKTLEMQKAALDSLAAATKAATPPAKPK
jgi:hypothetical protein